MIPREIAAGLLLAIGGIVFLLWVGLDMYLERKHMTEARRMEVEAKRAKGVTRPKRHIWHIVGPILMIGVPALFIVDGLILRIGLLYSPHLSFLNPVDTYVQIAGIVLASTGIVVMVVAGITVVLQVYAKASEERRIITTGIYAYIGHPLYLSFSLIPIGMFLITLNYLGILLLPPFLFTTNSDLEVCGRKGKMLF